jgi:hypothetical protein
MEDKRSIGHVMTCHKAPGEHVLEVAYDDVVVKGNSIGKMFDAIDKVSSGERVKKLMIMGEHTEITKEARQLMVQENTRRKNKIIAEAIVVHNFAQKLNANFYMALARHIYPIRFFTDKLQAQLWLENYQ